MEQYFSGEKLYGNDFTSEQIKKWFEEESEAYSSLGNKDIRNYTYRYHTLNKLHGFSKIKGKRFDHVLGIGSAWGYEFEPIVDKIENVTIIEPSDLLVGNKIGHLIPTYIKPAIDGSIAFEDETVDLITCFGALHHIPNVGFILEEMVRVLKKGGYILLREPIISMGDWRNKRPGLTKNERGIPLSFFEGELKKYPIKVMSKQLCFTATSFLQLVLGKYLKKPLYSYRFYLFIDKYLSNLLKNNVIYHATKKKERIAPSSVFYVLQKKED